MSGISQVKEDLQYVAETVRRANARAVPSIFLLWAVLVPVGFALADFRPDWCGPFWFVAGPAGGILSWLIGRAESRRSGQADMGLGRRYAWHWSTVTVAYFLLGISAATGHFDIKSCVQTFMLLTALAYTLAGVHLNRQFLPSGVIMFAGYCALTWLPLSYVWTTTGLFVSAALLTAAFRSRAIPASE